MRVAIGFLLSAACVLGQVIINPFNPPEFSPALSQYLALTNSQKQVIIDNISAHNQWTIQKRMRIAEVKQEIEVETNRLTLDPTAIGVRYAEIEAICRDIKDHTAQLRAQHIKVLTDQQKSRLAALEQVLSLMPVVIEAQGAGMVGGTRYGPASSIPVPSVPVFGVFGIPMSQVVADTSCEASTVPLLDGPKFYPPAPTRP